MTKYLTTTTITIHGLDSALTLTDTATYAGGSAAKSQILSRHDVHVKDANGNDLYIPFHAIVKAQFTPSTTTVEDPEDAFCTEPEDGGNDGNG